MVSPAVGTFQVPEVEFDEVHAPHVVTPTSWHSNEVAVPLGRLNAMLGASPAVAFVGPPPVVPVDGAANDVICTLAGTRLSRVIDAVAVSEPVEFPQVTVIVLGPRESVTELVVALLVEAAFTVQVTPAGIDAAPSTVKATFVDSSVVVEQTAR